MYMSGYSFAETERHRGIATGDDILVMPFTGSNLAKRILDILDGRGGLDDNRGQGKDRMTGIGCVFGGDRLDRLDVTTAAPGMAPERRAEAPLSGGLSEIDAGVAGRPGPGFAG